jgi:predicted Zn-dependent protease
MNPSTNADQKYFSQAEPGQLEEATSTDAGQDIATRVAELIDQLQEENLARMAKPESQYIPYGFFP